MYRITLFCLVSVMTLLPVFRSFSQEAKSAAPSRPLVAASPLEETLVIKDIPYVAHPSEQQNFDLYLPREKAAKPYPFIIWIHGGAWMLGSKDWITVSYLVKHGYTVASIGYRFSSEAPFPAQIQDCNAAMNFILAHAAEYDLDPKRFLVGGGSAGGHLALLLGLARHEKDFGANPGNRPLAVLDFFGPADFTTLLDDLHAIHSEPGIANFNKAVPALLGAPPQDAPEKAKRASPITYIGADNPPVLIVHGGKDDAVPTAQSLRLHEALDAAHVKNRIIILENSGHDGPDFSTPEVEAKVVAFLDEIFQKPR